MFPSSGPYLSEDKLIIVHGTLCATRGNYFLCKLLRYPRPAHNSFQIYGMSYVLHGVLNINIHMVL